MTAFRIASYLIAMSSLAAFFWQLLFGFKPQGEFAPTDAAINFVLFLIFPLQHSLFARKGWKERFTRAFPHVPERSFYVLTSGVALWIVLLGWKTESAPAYDIPAGPLFLIIYITALVLVIMCTVLLGHAEMFGLKEPEKTGAAIGGKLSTSGLYGIVRHPITALFLVLLWSHARVTVSRLELNLLFSAYALLGTYFEERDLVRTHGDEYRSYRRKVPAFFPRLLPRRN